MRPPPPPPHTHTPGTANGGSALLWASIMEMCGIPDGKIVTLDVTNPSWSEGQQHWGGVPRQDPTKHDYWKRHVSFMQVRGAS